MLLLMVSSLVEASMYAFIFEWTPALTTEDRSPPLGIIFSCFMLAYMMGSCASLLSFVLYFKKKADTIFMTLIYISVRQCIRLYDFE